MILGYIAINVAFMGVLLWSRAVLAGFLRGHEAIESAATLDEFKGIVRRNMYAALGSAVFGVVSLIWAVLLIREYGAIGLVVVLALSAPLLLLSLSTNKLERRSRSLACDPVLQEEYARVSEVWIKKALPDF